MSNTQLPEAPKTNAFSSGLDTWRGMNGLEGFTLILSKLFPHEPTPTAKSANIDNGIDRIPSIPPTGTYRPPFQVSKTSTGFKMGAGWLNKTYISGDTITSSATAGYFYIKVGSSGAFSDFVYSATQLFDSTSYGYILLATMSDGKISNAITSNLFTLNCSGTWTYWGV